MRIALLWLAMVAALTIGNPAAARWLKAETQNFVIYSEGSEKSLRDYAEKLQRFDATLRQRFKLTDAADPNPLTIYLVQRSEQAARLATGDSKASVAGFYVASPEGSFAVSNREDNSDRGPGTSEAQQILFHEYAHHFMHRYVTAALPAWFVEGFAEFYSTVDFTKDLRAETGKPPYGRAYGLLEMPKIPVAEILTRRPSEMGSARMIDVYYGRSWLLTHMLYNDPARAGQLTDYVAAINAGVDAKEAAIKHFGDLAQLDKDLARYLAGKLTYRTTSAPVTFPGGITIMPLSDAEDAVLPWRLDRRSGGDDAWMGKVVAGLTKVSATHSGDPGAWFELAAAHWDMSKEKRDTAAARAAVDRALAIDPKHIRANALLGDMMAAELADSGEDSEAAWRKVRAPIARANRANPDDPVPLFAYYRSFVSQGIRPPDIAISGLARAFELAPENIGIRVAHAFALANAGDFDGALKLARTVAFNPHDNGNGKQLLDTLENMRAGKAAAGAKADAAMADTAS